MSKGLIMNRQPGGRGIPMQRRNLFGPIFCLLGAMILWASSFIALKLAFAAYNPMVVIFGRMITASICLHTLRWRL